MTALDLDAIKARANAATKGPWEAQNYDDDEMDGNWPCMDRVGQPSSAKALVHVVLGSPDAEFIAHAREDIPALIARIRELEAEQDRKAFTDRTLQSRATQSSRSARYRRGWSTSPIFASS